MGMPLAYTTRRSEYLQSEHGLDRKLAAPRFGLVGKEKFLSLKIKSRP
jgi:hypothetical protein